jgi:phosphohistidine phosphatase SixA
VAQWLRERSEDQSVALVGHPPLLDRLASPLVADDQDAHVISFQMGAWSSSLPKPERGGFAVAWVLAPDIA